MNTQTKSTVPDEIMVALIRAELKKGGKIEFWERCKAIRDAHNIPALEVLDFVRDKAPPDLMAEIRELHPDLLRGRRG